LQRQVVEDGYEDLWCGGMVSRQPARSELVGERCGEEKGAIPAGSTGLPSIISAAWRVLRMLLAWRLRVLVDFDIVIGSWK
jgi:hypothetical protein